MFGHLALLTPLRNVQKIYNETFLKLFMAQNKSKIVLESTNDTCSLPDM